MPRDLLAGEPPAAPRDLLAPRPERSMTGAAGTWLENVVPGIPVVGPMIQTGADYLGTEVMGRLSGQDPAQMREDIWKRREGRAEQYPASAASGGLAGALAGTAAAAATAPGAAALGITGPSLGMRSVASGLSGAGISGADTAVRGGSAADIINSTAIGGGIGGLIPVAGETVKRLIGASVDAVAPTINAVRNPTGEASRRLGVAINRDTAAGATITPQDEMIAQRAGIDLLNVDRGGDTTRALARSVANQSPEARQVLEKAANDRFETQAPRAVKEVQRILGGPADDVAFQDAIRKSAEAANRPAYRAAYASPNAQAMWNEGYEQLMQAPAMQQAAKDAIGRGANRAAAEGFQPVTNPFMMQDGRLVLRKNADGTIAQPTLQFWDQVKRNLDDQIGAAQRSGERSLSSDLMGLKRSLTGMLDESVPEYQAARQGAAAFFGAEDALDAGRNFLNSPRSIPETKKAYEKFTTPERKAFAVGFVSEMVDKIKVSGDRTNVINRIFKSPAAREQMELAMGAKGLKQVEAYVRVEDIADRLRGTMGNSTTARQLVELGLGAAGGAAIGGDWQSATIGALAAKGARVAGQRIDNRVMQQVAKLLTSNDPDAITKAAKQAAQSPALMRQIEQMGDMLGIVSRGTALQAQ